MFDKEIVLELLFDLQRYDQTIEWSQDQEWHQEHLWKLKTWNSLFFTLSKFTYWLQIPTQQVYKQSQYAAFSLFCRFHGKTVRWTWKSIEFILHDDRMAVFLSNLSRAVLNILKFIMKLNCYLWRSLKLIIIKFILITPFCKSSIDKLSCDETSKIYSSLTKIPFDQKH